MICWRFWRVLAYSGVFWRVLLCSGDVLGRSGLISEMLNVLACSGVFWCVLGVFWGVLGCSMIF
jgi:hypothetical protein